MLTSRIPVIYSGYFSRVNILRATPRTCLGVEKSEL